ncbi:hypothetical protein FRC07_015097 [Ceratobasidium sp. 392]|nr:hypothetical protein FRC07_015097 [Ceratobasidium sp. 392]
MPHANNFLVPNSALQDIKVSFDAASKPRHLNLRKAERNLQALEDLERNIDTLIELTKLRLELIKVEGLLDNNPKVIGAHQIQDQIILPSARDLFALMEMIEGHGHVEMAQAVTTSQRTGHVGKIPVQYTTYSGGGTAEAARVVYLPVA